MTIQDWGSIGEIVGAVGVVASLLYLAIQVRQSSRIAKNATTQSILGSSALTNSQLAGDAAPVFLKLMSGEDFTDDDEARFRLAFMGIFAAHWQVFYQHRQGMIDDDIFDAYERRTLFFFDSPRVRHFWRSVESRFGTDYQSYIATLATRAAQRGVAAGRQEPD